MHRLEKNILHHAKQRKEQRSLTPHYFVKNGKYKPMFILWEDAFEYCQINNLNIDCICKSYKY